MNPVREHCTVLLGTGGWVPTDTRATNATLLICEQERLLLDAGTGVARLVQRPDLLGSAGRLDIVLTHFHLDHIVGLSYLPAVAGLNEIAVWAPGEMLCDVSSLQILENAVGGAYCSLPLSYFVNGVHELREGQNDIGGRCVHARVQPGHTGKSVALRVDDELTLCTDTSFDPGSSDFASGCKRLLHEAWTVNSPADVHSSKARKAVSLTIVLLALFSGIAFASTPVGASYTVENMTRSANYGGHPRSMIRISGNCEEHLICVTRYKIQYDYWGWRNSGNSDIIVAPNTNNWTGQHATCNKSLGTYRGRMDMEITNKADYSLSVGVRGLGASATIPGKATHWFRQSSPYAKGLRC